MSRNSGTVGGQQSLIQLWRQKYLQGATGGEKREGIKPRERGRGGLDAHVLEEAN